MKLIEIIKPGFPIPKKYDAITLYPFIFYRSPAAFRRWRDHEMIHVEQIRRYGWLRFYVLYLWYNFTVGYENNLFEIEAYARAKS
jgi:hypothetical protein